MHAVMDKPGTEDPVVLRRRDIRYLREQGALTLRDAIAVVEGAEAGHQCCMVMVARAHALNLFTIPYGAACLV